MDSHLDITLLPDPELPATVIMNAVYIKLHKVLCDLNSVDIGVSFPAYKVTLGNVLRVHGEAVKLVQLQQLEWLGGMSGYCSEGKLTSVPQNCCYRNVCRVQINMSQAKLNRLLKRGSITDAQAVQYRAEMLRQGLDQPFIELKSSSNGNRYRRYIALGELLNKPIVGTFDQFGLSKTATVPWF